MSALVDALQKGQVTGDYTLAAVLDGPEAGSRMLLRGGRPVWQTHSLRRIGSAAFPVCRNAQPPGFWNWTARGCLWNDSVRCRRSLSAAAAM